MFFSVDNTHTWVLMNTPRQNERIRPESNRLLQQYIHEIRNLKILTKEMIHTIRNMSCEDKMEIILVFNDVVEGLQQLID